TACVVVCVVWWRRYRVVESWGPLVPAPPGMDAIYTSVTSDDGNYERVPVLFVTMRQTVDWADRVTTTVVPVVFDTDDHLRPVHEAYDEAEAEPLCKYIGVSFPGDGRLQAHWGAKAAGVAAYDIAIVRSGDWSAAEAAREEAYRATFQRLFEQ